MRAEGDERLAKIALGMLPGIKEMVEGLKVGEGLDIGQVSEEPPTCYHVSIHKFSDGRTLIDVVATTVVRGKLVNYYLKGPFKDADTVTTMLAAHKKNIAALYAANQN